MKAGLIQAQEDLTSMQAEVARKDITYRQAQIKLANIQATLHHYKLLMQNESESAQTGLLPLLIYKRWITTIHTIRSDAQVVPPIIHDVVCLDATRAQQQFKAKPT